MPAVLLITRRLRCSVRASIRTTRVASRSPCFLVLVYRRQEFAATYCLAIVCDSLKGVSEMFFLKRRGAALAIVICVGALSGCTPYNTRAYQPWGPAPSPPNTSVQSPPSVPSPFDADMPRANAPDLRQPLDPPLPNQVLDSSPGSRLFPNITRPNWSSPGTIQQQRTRAALHDPYADNLMAPEIVGGRPREFSRPTGPTGIDAGNRQRRSP